MTTIVEDTGAAFKLLGKSVCILTCHQNEKRHASVATAVCNISGEPPTLLVCVEKTASFAALLISNAGFVVNIIAAEQQDILTQCMNSQGEDRFGLGQWTESKSGQPVLSQAQANLVCSVTEVHDAASHHVVFANIEEAHSDKRGSALIYFNSKFHPIATA
jgi:flavin reductase (DIM6/NTAB) family NADH-FMN oxidoreductase RutF